MQQETENHFDPLLSQFGEAEIFPVVTNVPADFLTPLGAYYTIAGDSEYSFLFESVEGGEQLARYSFIGADPLAKISDGAEGVEIAEGGEDRRSDKRLLDYLHGELRQRRLAKLDDLPSFVGGAVGVLDFSLVEQIEPVLGGGDAKPGRGRSEFMIFRRVIAFDHVKQVINIVSLVFAADANGDRTRFLELLRKAETENRRIAGKLEKIRIPESQVNKQKPDIDNQYSSNFTKEDFEDSVLKIKELILAGECYQVVLSQCFSRRTEASPRAIYRALRSLNPSPYMFLMRLGKRSVIGASPEMLVRCRDGSVEYRPIAGTRPRGKNAEHDLALAKEMAADEKECSEHTMLVDLGRNDIGRVSRYGSVKVKELMAVEKYSHVQHLVTYLNSELKDDLDCFDALVSCFPAGTVSGAPKIRALQIIRELEPTERGVYAGAVGYIDYAGNLDTCIAIRTIVLEGDAVKIQAGAGIVADSVPEREFEETIHKAQGLFAAVELAESGRFGR